VVRRAARGQTARGRGSAGGRTHAGLDLDDAGVVGGPERVDDRIDPDGAHGAQSQSAGLNLLRKDQLLDLGAEGQKLLVSLVHVALHDGHLVDGVKPLLAEGEQRCPDHPNSQDHKANLRDHVALQRTEPSLALSAGAGALAVDGKRTRRSGPFTVNLAKRPGKAVCPQRSGQRTSEALRAGRRRTDPTLMFSSLRPLSFMISRARVAEPSSR